MPNYTSSYLSPFGIDFIEINWYEFTACDDPNIA